MKGKLFRLAGIFAFLFIFAVLTGSAASAGNGPSTPPGRDPCGHGATNKPCRPDPQPEHGKDCDHHGNNGGVNEDHCKGETPTDNPPPVNPPPVNPPPATPPSTPPTTPPGTTQSTTTSTTPVTPLEVSCPVGTTRNDQLSKPGLLVCMQPVPGPVKVVERVVTMKVFGKPKCPKGTKPVKGGPGLVVCLRTKIKNKVKYVTKVRVVRAPKPAYTR